MSSMCDRLSHLLALLISPFYHCSSPLPKQRCTVDLPGGPLDIEWSEKDNHIYMTGPAEVVFYGSAPL